MEILKKLILVVGLAFSTPVFCQIAVTPKAGTYPFTALSGEPLNLYTQITSGGTICTAGLNSCTVNWSCSTTGGATCKFTDLTHSNVSSISGGQPTVTLNTGGSGGTCSITPSNTNTGPWTASSTSTITVTAQSVDDNTKSGTFSINVCADQSGSTLANGDKTVRILPFYDQMYPGTYSILQSYVAGSWDQTGTWTITSQPGGGDGSLGTNPQRDVVFTATVSGRYQITYTSTATSGTNFATIYVVPGSAPSYLATPNGTKPVPCVLDPANTGPDYEVGPSQAHTTISSLPAFNTIPAGATIRIHNEDLTGLSPTTYAEYWVVQTGGSAVNPVNICGVPDSLGNLPVISSAGAVGQASMQPTNGTVGYGLFSLWGTTHSGYWQTGTAGPGFVRIAGLAFHATNGADDTYTQPGGGSGQCMCNSGGDCPVGAPANGPTCWWSKAQVGIRIQSGHDIVITGIETTTVQGVFSDDNTSNSGYTIYSQNLLLDGSNLHNCGWLNAGSHCAYLQSLFTTVQGTQIGPGHGTYYTSGEGPSGLKMRGAGGIVRYNNFGSALARVIDLVDTQGGGPYVSMNQYIALMWNGATLSGFDTAGQGIIAAYQAALQNDFVYGNIIVNTGGGGGQVHYGGDTGISYDSTYRAGTLYAYSNTALAGDLFDTGYSSLGLREPIIDARNNIFWPAVGSTISSLTRYFDVSFAATSNLFKTSSISTATPLAGGSGGWAGGNQCSNIGSATPNPSVCPFPLTSPLNTRMPGYAGQYLFTGTQPFNSGTFVIPAGSAAISAGTALTGLPAQLPVRFQYNVSTNVLTPRSLSDRTLGAQQYVSGATSVSSSGVTISGATIQ